jgi:tetratricopeptide (TPR) repeat protein
MPAAVSLLGRAADLLPEHDPRRLELLPELAFALGETADFDRLVAVSRTMDEAAAVTGDPTLRAHASVVALRIRLFTDPEGWAAEAERVAAEAIRSFGELGDERGLGRAWALLGLVRLMYARCGPSEEAWSQAAEHARRAGQRREAMESLAWVPLMLASGPTPAEQGIRRCREVFERADGDRKVMSSALFSQADFEAYLGRFDEARNLLARARALLEEVALPVWAAGPLAQEAGWIELLAGDPVAAEAALRSGFDMLDAIGEVAWLSTDAGILAEAVDAQGRYDEALRFTRISEELAGTEDVYSNVLWRSVRAKVLARRGETAEAIRLANVSTRLAERTDFLHLRWHDLMCRTETFRLAGRTADADAAAEEAVRLAAAKGNMVGARLARDARAHGFETARRR